MLDILVRDANTARTQSGVAERLLQPRLWVSKGSYPGHPEWRDKAIGQLQTGQKLAKVLYFGDVAAGTIVYQRHPELPNTVEIKNISVDDSVKGRNFASFLLRQVEVEIPNEFPGTTQVVGDAKLSNTGMVGFARACGFMMSIPTLIPSNFGHNHDPDVYFSKTLQQEPRLTIASHL